MSLAPTATEKDILARPFDPVHMQPFKDDVDEADTADLAPSNSDGAAAARDPCSNYFARIHRLMRDAKLPLLLVLIALLSALTKIGINSFTGVFWHFRREITNYLQDKVGRWLAVIYWIAHGVALLCAAVFWTAKFGSQAIGSGIPEVKSILSGSNPRNFLTSSCFFSKVVGLSLAVASGLQIGSEGPDIHIAVIISRMLMSASFFGFALRNKDITMLVFSASAAAGVATSFGAPMSGVMFTVEIVGSYFVVSHYTSMFTASMVAGSVFMLLNNLVQDNPLIDSEYNLDNCNTVLQSALFKAICSIKNYTPIYKYVNAEGLSKLTFISSFWNLMAYVFIGAVFGLLSAAYITVQAKLRLLLQPVMTRNKYLLPIIVAIVSGLLTFPGFTDYLSYMPKRSMQDLLLARPLDSPSNATLDLHAHANDWGSTGSVVGSLAVFFVVKLVLLAFAIVLPIPCGFMGPIMTLGAAGGRFFGELFLMWGLVSDTVRPEAFAIAGAAAFATGISRALVTPLLFFEMTGQINQPFSVFVAVITSYLVGNKFSLSMYDTLGVIGSTFSLRQFKRTKSITGESSTAALACPVFLSARKTDVTPLPRTCRNLDIQRALNSCADQNFPVVDSLDTMQLIASAPRWALEALVIQRMQTALRASLGAEDKPVADAGAGAAGDGADADVAVSSADSGPDFAGLADADIETSVENPSSSDIQLSRVQLMRLRMRRQLAAQLACTAQRRVFLMEQADLLDAEVGVGAFVNKYPPTVNAAASLASLKTRMSVSPNIEYFIVSCGKLLGCIRRNDENTPMWQF